MLYYKAFAMNELKNHVHKASSLIGLRRSDFFNGKVSEVSIH